MVFITGGAYQGKLDYALKLTGGMESDVTDCKTCDFESIYSAKILNNFHLLIKRMLENNLDVREAVCKLIQINNGVTIIINELGCGVIPTDRFERMYRETTGRISCIIAKEADEVHRVICGIGMVIKNG